MVSLLLSAKTLMDTGGAEDSGTDDALANDYAKIFANGLPLKFMGGREYHVAPGNQPSP